jgi:hypothetical protein
MLVVTDEKRAIKRICNQERRVIFICCNRHYLKIKAVIIDERFGRGLCVNGHDWAIMELEEPLKFDENVVPICLPGNSTTLQSNLIAVSYGRPKSEINIQSTSFLQL